MGDGREWLGLSRTALSPGGVGLSRQGTWPSLGLEQQLLWLRLDSDGKGLRTSLAAAGLDRRTHLSFSLIFLRTEGKWKDKWHQPLICSELLRYGSRTSGQALGKGRPSPQHGSACPRHRECRRSSAVDKFVC